MLPNNYTRTLLESLKKRKAVPRATAGNTRQLTRKTNHFTRVFHFLTANAKWEDLSVTPEDVPCQAYFQLLLTPLAPGSNPYREQKLGVDLLMKP